MARGRILLVDDSVIVRKVVAEMIAADAEMELVATASNGRLALDKLHYVNPDLVILDVEMPEMGGIETLKEIRARLPDLPVLMFSGLTERAGALTLDALLLGASDYVTKPSNLGSVLASAHSVRDELLAKMKMLLRRAIVVPQRSPALPAVVQPFTPVSPRNPKCVDLVAIGASTGGPNALAEIIAAFPANFPVPIVIAQHMPPLFTKLFAERLTEQSALRVREGATGEKLRPGEVWLAPGDHHLSVKRDRDELVLYVHQGVPENSCRPSVDVLFRSVAEACGAGVLGIVLTGMGMDGLRGCEHIRASGGQVVVQDEASSVVWGMPGSVARAGLADGVVSLGLMCVEILRRVSRDRAVPAAGSRAESGARGR